MTSYKPEHQIQLMIHSNVEIFRAIKESTLSLADLEKVWFDLFNHRESTESKLIIESYRILYETGLSVMLKIGRTKAMDKNQQSELNKELSYKDSARYLNCSVSTIKRLVQNNKIKARHYNRKNVKIAIQELERFKLTAT